MPKYVLKNNKTQYGGFLNFIPMNKITRPNVYGPVQTINLPIPLLSDSPTSLRISSPTFGSDIILTGTPVQLNNIINLAKDLKKPAPKTVDTYQPVSISMLDNPPLDSTQIQNQTNNLFMSYMPQNISNGWSMGKISGSQNGLIYKNLNQLKYFSGAGILFVERTYNNGTKQEPTILLFGSSNGQVYQETGGSIDPTDFNGSSTLQNAAIRETLEESSNYLEIKTVLDRSIGNKPMYIDITHNQTYYRCYVIGIDEQSFNVGSYIGNLDKLAKTQFLPDAWSEMSSVKRFYISDIKKALSQKQIDGTILCRDVNQVDCTIRGRTVQVIQAGLDTSIIETAINYVNPTREYTNAIGMRKLLVY